MKRGQVTTFFIIALLIISLVVTIYFVKDTVFFNKFKRQTQEAISIPEFAKDIRSYVESCISDTLNRGVDIMSSQAGYITLPIDPYPTGPFNPFSNSLDLFSQGKTFIPYWFYQSANGIEKIQMPTLKSMEDQLAIYLNIELEKCLSDFNKFKERNYIINKDQIISKIIINKEDISATVNFPINIKYNNQEFNLERFKIPIKRNLGKLYNLAKEIFLKENANFFIENYILDSFVIYSDKIPYSGIDFECSPKIWTRREVTENIKSILTLNIPEIKIKGSNVRLNKDFDKYFLIDAASSYEDVNINFFYSKNWPILIDILDENSEIIKGKPYTTENALSRFLMHIFCLNEYHFVYDIKFPVLTTLYDEKSNDLFQFATMVIIDNNQPRENAAADITELEFDSKICKYPETEIKVYALGVRPDNSMQPLDNTKISFKCITSVCNIGYTKSEGNENSLTARFPKCFNGQIIAEHEGYHKATEFISTTEESTISMLLEPIYELEFKAMIVDNGNVRPIQPTEQVYFTFENTEKDYIATAVYPGTDKIRLISGTYDVKSHLIVKSDSGISIPQEQIKVCVDAPKEGILGVIGLKEKKCRTQTIDPISLDQVFAGGSSFTWNPDRKTLSDSKKLTAYTTRFEIPKSIQELTDIDDKILKNSNNIRPPDLE